MKVLYLIDSLMGYGAEKSLTEIITRFTIVSPVIVHLFEGGEMCSFIKEKGIKIYSLELQRENFFNQAVKEVSSIIKEEHPQIIHSTLFRAELVSRKLKQLFPDIILVGSFVSNSYSNRRYSQLSVIGKIKLLFTYMKDRLTIDSVDFFISNSEVIKDSNSKALGVPISKIRTIHRGREVPRLSFDNEIPDGLQDITKKRVFLNIGRLQPSKGQGDLLLAFKEVTIKYKDVILLIAGDGNYRKELESRIEDLGLNDEVFLLGYRQDITHLLAFADFFIFPTYFEGLPGALLEALFSKTPCILSDIPENNECVPRETALFFKPGDIMGMKKKMEKAMLLNDWEAKTRIALDHALAKFEIGRISIEYENFYLEISR